ncbi:MAG TPA: TlpA disulfide reductase family protein [Spirochaetota bacterium]|nr:TlpA disulfide reductase family protein [Spirochaetota bacterium]HOS32437.1 TlpA disulfide reductase family protein [Spirochaetota bacterium]HOS55900.1 TlpA disulfide reductase family protein [Spirochaetota bacterium]HQF77482.1 TlpA disulfide reductase family protein [Spirochaetota bacterium]HQH30230.1 TlpA disulfide reductase family protein [Spirochaetota bacterium]
MIKKICIFIVYFILIFRLFSYDEVFKNLNDDCLKTGEFNTKIFYKNLDNVAKGSRDEIKIFDELLRFYVNIYQPQRNERNLDIEKVISDKLGDKERLRALLYYINRYAYNQYFDAQADYYLKLSENSDENDAKNYLFFYNLYKWLSLYKRIENKTEEDWRTIYNYLRSAKKIAPVTLHDKIALDVYKNTGNWREYFETKALSYYTLEDKSLFKDIELFFDYLKIKGDKKKFSEEIGALKSGVKEKFLKSVVTFKTKTALNPFRVVDLENREKTINPNADGSKYAGKKMIIVFFNTSCQYCKKELKYLTKLKNKYDFSLIAVNTMYSNSKTAIEETKEYMKNNRINADFYLDQNGVKNMRANGLISVPAMILASPDNYMIKRAAIKYSGHIEMRMEWLLKDFLE